jgi:hypothetical protein
VMTPILHAMTKVRAREREGEISGLVARFSFVLFCFVRKVD